MHQPPEQIKQTAILQLVSGIITLTVMFCLSGTVVGGIGFVCTLVLGGFGGICGMIAWLLIPIGLFEVISGIIGLTNPEGAGQVMKICSFFEIGGILFGGITTAIAGGVALTMLNSPEVKAYIEG